MITYNFVGTYNLQCPVETTACSSQFLALSFSIGHFLWGKNRTLCVVACLNQMSYLSPPCQCVELFATMVEKVHAVDPLQYVLTLLADLTHDERNVVLLVKTAQGSVNPTSHVLPLKLHGYTCVFCLSV